MSFISKSKKGGYETKKVELKGWWRTNSKQAPNCCLQQASGVIGGGCREGNPMGITMSVLILTSIHYRVFERRIFSLEIMSGSVTLWKACKDLISIKDWLILRAQMLPGVTVIKVSNKIETLGRTRTSTVLAQVLVQRCDTEIAKLTRVEWKVIHITISNKGYRSTQQMWSVKQGVKHLLG